MTYLPEFLVQCALTEVDTEKRTFLIALVRQWHDPASGVDADRTRSEMRTAAGGFPEKFGYREDWPR